MPKVTSLKFETDFDEVRYDQSTAAGFGYQGRKGPREGDNYKKAKKIANAAITQYERDLGHNPSKEHVLKVHEQLSEQSTPDVAFTRTQLTKLPKLKVRNVYGEAFHYVLLEGLTAQPLIDDFMSRDEFYYIGKEPDRDVPRLLFDVRNYVGRDNRGTEVSTNALMVIDWSAFDASVQPWEINLAFDLLEARLIFPTTRSKLAFDYSRVLFMKRKLAAPDGTLFMRYSGVPSGSCFTHIVDSIVNWVRIRYMLRRFGVGYTKVFTHGDDGLIGLEKGEKPPLSEIAEFCAPLGWTFNPSKCQYSTETHGIEFLGRSAEHALNVRDQMRCLRLALFPEYPVDTPEISVARVGAILRDSGYAGSYLSEIYRALVRKYGIHTSLPSKFRTFFQRHDDVTLN